MKTKTLIALLFLPMIACAADGEWENLLPKQTSLLDAEWRDGGQGGPTDKGRPEVRTKTWSIDPDTGSLLCAGKPYGLLLTKKSYADFELEIEFRWLPREGEVDWETKGWDANSGIFVRMDRDLRDLPDTLLIMHQVELATNQDGGNPRIRGGRVSTDGTLYRMAQKVASNGKWRDHEHGVPAAQRGVTKQVVGATWPEPGPELPPAGKSIRHPINEWNHYRITCVGPVIRVWQNGEPIIVVANAQALKGSVGVESEGRPFEIRTFRLRGIVADPAGDTKEANPSPKQPNKED